MNAYAIAPTARSTSVTPLYTGPLSFLAGSRALIVVDAQNLVETARYLGFRPAWKSLRRIFQEICTETFCHAVFAAEPGDDYRHRFYEERGWTPHAKRIYWREQDGVRIRESNADIAVAASVGMLVAEYRPDWLIYGSGDGPLGIDTVQQILDHNRYMGVATLSVAGSLSGRLLKTRALGLIEENITLGHDCLVPNPSSAGVPGQFCIRTL